MSTISGTVNGVVIGQGAYTSPLTITATGYVTTNVGDVVCSSASATVLNAGTITGGTDSGIYFLNGGSVDNTGLIQGFGVFVGGAAGTITNAGTIASVFRGVLFPTGIVLLNGGSVDNTGLIQGYGVSIRGASGNITNAGTIAASASNGIFLSNGGSVDNTGLIQGYGCGVVVYEPADITNNGGLIIGNAGIKIQTHNIVTNTGTIVGTGSVFGTNGFGVYAFYGGTVINSGTIIGDSAAIYFRGGAGGANRLVLQPGYALGGAVIGDDSATNTVELQGAVVASYNGLGLVGFQHVQFGAGDNATLLVSNNTGTLGITIAGFDAGSETIDLTGIGGDGQITNFDTAADRVTVTGSLGSLTLQFNSIDGLNFGTAPDGTGGTSLIACFRRGTSIRTDAGERPVEELAIGDRVVTASGTPRAIKWIGRRAYDARFIAGNTGVLPIRIEAGALDDGVPARDLFVSPEHAMVIDGLFLPARLLVNGATIRQVAHADRLEYFHLELDSHDVVFAEGATAETFVDFGGRAMFHNAVEFAALYPDAAPAEWEPYAALLEAGMAGLASIRAALLARAESLGRISRDPDLHLIVDGEAVRPQRVADRVHSFAVPAGARHVTVASRSVVPGETEVGSLDPRRLGVPFERAVLDGPGLRIELGPDHPALADGFHRDEGSHRWTDGGGALPPQLLACFTGDLTIALQIGATDLHYIREPAGSTQAEQSNLSSAA